MAIYWPLDLPMGIKYGAETELGKGAKISTDMDYGNKKRRQRFTNVPAYQTVSMKFTDVQFQTFSYFYKYILLHGTCSFYTRVVTPSGIEYRRCTIDDDTVTVTHADYNYHTVSFTVEIYDFEGMVLDPGSMWLIGYYGETLVLEMCDVLQRIVNVDYPKIMERY